MRSTGIGTTRSGRPLRVEVNHLFRDKALNVFDTHRQVVQDYARYIRSFINISDPEIAQRVEDSLSEGRLWPQPLLQFNSRVRTGWYG